MVTTPSVLSVPEQAAYGFECSACGKCCNSPPLVTIPELFKHQHRFFGNLALRTVYTPPSQTAWPALDTRPDPNAPTEALIQRMLYPVAGSIRLYAALQGQAFGFPSQPRCSELLADGKCAIHGQGKPTVCSIVPLDALEPDHRQSDVLASRLDEAVFLGAECISREPPSSPRAVARGAHLVNEPLRLALSHHRRALELEKHYWGNRVFAFLGSGPNAIDWHALPPGSWMEVAITPVLATVAELSPNCRLRTIEYAHSQILLGEKLAHAAEARRSVVDFTALQRLRGYVQALSQLKRVMLSRKPPFNGDVALSLEAERWLGA